MSVLGLVAETERLPRLAVLVPCFNESLTIGQVIDDFRAALPTAQIYVYDNNSTDGTAEVARAAGAIVRVEPRQGKGNVVRRMFGDIEADIYILVDGDGTYDAKAAPFLVGRVLKDDLDFVNGARAEVSQQAYRRGHRLGNRVLTGLVQGVFGREFRDMLSGYKVMSRRFVKSFPAMSSGFETETELVVHALELRMPAAEVTTAYHERPEGSVSKLRTYRDGARILYLILRLMKDERPLQFFGVLQRGAAGRCPRAGHPSHCDLRRDWPRAPPPHCGAEPGHRDPERVDLLHRDCPGPDDPDPPGAEAPALPLGGPAARCSVRRRLRAARRTDSRGSASSAASGSSPMPG